MCEGCVVVCNPRCGRVLLMPVDLRSRSAVYRLCIFIREDAAVIAGDCFPCVQQPLASKFRANDGSKRQRCQQVSNVSSPSGACTGIADSATDTRNVWGETAQEEECLMGQDSKYLSLGPSSFIELLTVDKSSSPRGSFHAIVWAVSAVLTRIVKPLFV